jgi:5-methylcytosine-specific restriction endonuclease McrBC regulatory subunit McrC
VLWEKNFPWLGGKSKEIFCRYHQLTYNNIDNQIVLSGLKKAFFLAGVPEVKRQVGEFLNIVNSFALEKPIMLADFQKAQKGYDRLNEHYRVAHALTKMLLYNLRPEDLFKEGQEEVFGVVLDMAEIFERFVERFISDLLMPRGFSLLAQHKDSGALIDDNGYRYAGVQPDIEVWLGNKAIGIIDAKYKDYWATAEDGFNPDRKISNEDLYQLFFYQQRMQRKYGLPSLPLALIAAPLPAEDEREKKLIVHERFRRIRFHVGVESEGDVRLVLIPIAHFLRLLNGGISPREAAILVEQDLDSPPINWSGL